MVMKDLIHSTNPCPKAAKIVALAPGMMHSFPLLLSADSFKGASQCTGHGPLLLGFSIVLHTFVDHPK